MKNQSRFLISCNGIVVDPSAKQLPMEIDALIEGQHGKHQRMDGTMMDVVITAADINAAVDYVKRRRQREPNRLFVLDFEHQTLYGDVAPAAGWYRDLNAITRDGKSVARATIDNWTPNAAQMILNGEYRYVSPVFAQDTVDPDTGKFEKCMLINIGLTNEPFLKNMMPLAASKFLIPQEDSVMNKVIARLIAVFKLANDASEDVVLAKVNEHFTAAEGAIAAKGKIIGVLGLKAEDTIETIEAKAKAAVAFRGTVIAKLELKPEATDEEIGAMLVAAKTGATDAQKLQARVIVLETSALTKEVDAIIAKGVQEGKIIPAVRAEYEAWAKKDLAGFQAFMAKAPVVGPVGQLPTNIIAAKDGQLTDEEAAVAKQLGVSAEIVKKHNKSN